MTRLFIGTLKGVAFEWFRKLEPCSIKAWADVERLFLSRFFNDDTEVSMTTLLSERQKKDESVSEFVKRFRNKSLHSCEAISEPTLLEMCRNISIKILSKIGAVEARSWKELVWQGEQAEAILKRMEVEEPRSRRGSCGQGTTSSPQSKGKNTLAVETVQSPRGSQKQKGPSSNTRPPKVYDFKEEQVVKIFNSLLQGNKTKLPEIRRPEDINKTEDPNFCLYHRMVNRPTKDRYILKDKIQALLEAGDMTLKDVERKVTANMVLMEFGRGLPKVSVPSGLVPIPQSEMRVINQDPHNQRDKGLVPYHSPTGQVWWLHPDLLEDMCQETLTKNKPRWPR